MKYCLECGTKLQLRELANEGMIPYCVKCCQYRFPVFNTAVSMIVTDKSHRILLIRQYGRPEFILVAGYVNRGENAEETVARELMEEMGLKAQNIHYNRSRFFEKSNTLMLNFTVTVEQSDLSGMTAEVDDAQWFHAADALAQIKPESLAKEFLSLYLSEKNDV